MEINDENLQTLASYLEKTLSPDVQIRRESEKFLESVEGNQNYPLLLLHLMDKTEVTIILRVSSAIMFKNYVKRNWSVVDDIPDKIHASDREAVKQIIVGLMLKSPEQIQNQLSDAISIIGKQDFPGKWPNLLSDMITKFDSGDFNIINGILRTAHSLFKRYRHEFKSQELWTEIKFVLDTFADPLTRLFLVTMNLVATHSENPTALKVIFSSLILICKIFYSLNFQDLPEFFEDNMSTWMTHFLTLLTADNQLLRTQDDEDAGVLEQVKSQICDNITMYAQKYDEEFAPHLSGFVTAVWNLLVTTGPQVKFDLLVSNAISFLASVAERQQYKPLFEDSSTLSSICEKVIVPNIEFRTADEETFEDNPDEYIRRDIEGSDVDTRRRAACDLVKALSKSFEGRVTVNFSHYITSMLANYAQNPAVNWRNKDAAIFLVTSMAVSGQTQKHGATKASGLVDVNEFYSSQILTELEKSDVNERPVLIADSIKYLIVFRNQVPPESLYAALPHLIRFLSASSRVVHSYAASAIDKLLMVQSGGVSVFNQDIIAPHTQQLLMQLFGVLNQPGSEENEYVMKAIMRSLSVLKQNILPLIDEIVTQLTSKLSAVAKNPSKPHFNHYLFESLSIAIRTTCQTNKVALASFEERLFPPFQQMLQEDVQEFIPYVFQILALLLEHHETQVPAPYMQLFVYLLQPVLWQRSGNIPPLVRLLQAYVERGANQIQAEYVPGLLGIFQKLIASKTNDHQGFYLLNSMVQHMPGEMINSYTKNIFVLLFQRLTNSKTTKFIKSLLVFLSVFVVRTGASHLVQVVEEIQPGMFGMVIEKLFIPEVQKVSGSTERKICSVGIVSILCDCPEMLGKFRHHWVSLLQAIIGLFELPEDPSVPDTEHYIDVEDAAGYQTAYSQLAFAGKQSVNLCGSITNPKHHLAVQLAALAAHDPGISELASTGLPERAKSFLQEYMTSAGVKL